MNIQKIVSDPYFFLSAFCFLMGFYFIKQWKRQKAMFPNANPLQQGYIFYSLFLAIGCIIMGFVTIIIFVLEDGWGIYWK